MLTCMIQRKLIANKQQSYSIIHLAIIPMKNSTAIEPIASLNEATEGKHPPSQDNKINYSKGYIRINKHEIWFSCLSAQTKHVLASTLKQCLAQNCMKKVFCEWKRQDKIPSRGRMLRLSQEEAINLIWRMQRCLQKQKVWQEDRQIQQQIRTLKNYYQSYLTSYQNIQQKQQELQRLKVSAVNKQQKELLARQMKLFKQEMQQQMCNFDQKIRHKQLQHSKLQLKLKYTLDAPEMSNILTKAILKETRNLLRQSIIGILQQSHQIVPEGQPDLQQVYVVFEQAYQTKKILKKTIVRILGSEAYLEKIEKFNAFMEYREGLSQKEKIEYDQIICCHRCLKIEAKSKLRRCKTTIRAAQTSSYPSTDYFSYRKLHLEGDYFYEPQQQHILPYFLYNKNSNNQLSCNRAFCEECLLSIWGQNKNRPGCPYCKGLCGCSRCSMAYGIVKLIALDYQNDTKLQKIYHRILKLFAGDLHQAVKQSLPIRHQSSEISEIALLERLWTSNRQLHQCNKISIKPSQWLMSSLKRQVFKPNLYDILDLDQSQFPIQKLQAIKPEQNSKQKNDCKRVLRSKQKITKQLASSVQFDDICNIQQFLN